jgi:hypothetical protein
MLLARFSVLGSFIRPDPVQTHHGMTLNRNFSGQAPEQGLFRAGPEQEYFRAGSTDDGLSYLRSSWQASGQDLDL